MARKPPEKISDDEAMLRRQQSAKRGAATVKARVAAARAAAAAERSTRDEQIHRVLGELTTERAGYLAEGLDHSDERSAWSVLRENLEDAATSTWPHWLDPHGPFRRSVDSWRAAVKYAQMRQREESTPAARHATAVYKHRQYVEVPDYVRVANARARTAAKPKNRPPTRTKAQTERNANIAAARAVAAEANNQAFRARIDATKSAQAVRRHARTLEAPEYARATHSRVAAKHARDVEAHDRPARRATAAPFALVHPLGPPPPLAVSRRTTRAAPRKRKGGATQTAFTF